MEKAKNFKTEYQAFLQQYPYRTIEVDGTKIRYQYGGKEGAPVLLFFHGLEMQETWMPYALHFGQNYRFLIYEYPLHITNVDEQMAFTFALLKALAIRQVILITTLTLDSDYLRHIKKAWFVTTSFTFSQADSGKKGNEPSAEKVPGLFNLRITGRSGIRQNVL